MVFFLFVGVLPGRGIWSSGGLSGTSLSDNSSIWCYDHVQYEVWAMPQSRYASGMDGTVHASH